MSESGAKWNRGRSPALISIYNYPEDLNPFYEDENHKRLRFWNIGKRNGRRSSFSLGGLKEMWAFKSFRLKKKSSTLGINKTSESPPQLRRELQQTDVNYATYDPRLRNTTNGREINEYFQRNIPYRSSLQDMRSTQISKPNDSGFGFNRNDRYRNTLQVAEIRNGYSSLSRPRVPPRRYVHKGSVTPQPRNRYNEYIEYSEAISRGPSQISIASTNPFDDDDDDISKPENMEDLVKNEQSSLKQLRPIRKKRRAPPPPVSMPNVIDEEELNTPVTIVSKVNEENIASITEEIENFVKTTTDSIKADETSANQSNRIEEDTEIINKPITKEYDHLKNDTNKNKENEDVCDTNQEILNVNKIKEVPLPDNNLRQIQIQEENDSNKNKISENLIISNNNLDKITTDIKIVESYQQNLPLVLRITESLEDLTENFEKCRNSDDSSEKIQQNLTSKIPQPTPKIRESICKKRSLDSSESLSYDQRRSVKDIIESINHSQSLLKINQESIKASPITNNLNEPDIEGQSKKITNNNENNMNNNFVSLAESEREIKRMMNEMENLATNLSIDNDSGYSLDVFEKLNNELNNNNKENKNDIFKKCILKKEINRESSPTSSNLDWNPVPKPRRTKNLCAELGADCSLINGNNEN